MPRMLPLVDASSAACCAPLGAPSPTPAADAEVVAAQARALGDAGRVTIVRELVCCEGHELTTTQVAALLGVGAATANHHLKRLEEAGLVAGRRDGQRVLYRLDFGAAHQFAAMLNVRCVAACACD